MWCTYVGVGIKLTVSLSLELDQIELELLDLLVQVRALGEGCQDAGSDSC